MKRHLKKSLALLLAILMTLSTLSVMAMADDMSNEGTRINETVTMSMIDSGTCGNNLAWVLDDDGTLTISGTGEMYDYRSGTSPWNSYRDSINTVILEDGITSIGTYAFYYCTNLISATIPSGVTSIGNYAFWYCKTLTNVSIPEGVISIGAYAFSQCSSLTDITIPDSVISMGNYAFQYSGINSVQLGTGLTSISYEAFAYCSNLVSVIIPDNITSIESFAFYYASSLTTIKIPATITTIDYCAFQYCSNLHTVYYEGTEAEWNAIEIGHSNSNLTSAEIFYNVTGDVTARIVVSQLKLDSSGVKIIWNADSNAAGYYIYRATGANEKYALIQTITNGDVDSYTDNSVQDSVTYYYYVQAFTSGFLSEYETGKHITYHSAFVSDVADLTPEKTDNNGDQDYGGYPNYTGVDYSSPVYSYLETVDDGYMRVEYTGEKVIVEYYDNQFRLTQKKNVLAELPLFGCFYAGADAYYLVFGQENDNEDDTQEVLRVVKYSKNWERQDQLNIYGANTTVPFDAGSCRMDEGEGFLYIRTSHQMYTYPVDGLRHQSNLTIVIRQSDMTMSYIYYDIGNYTMGYISHSFNQFMMVDDEDNLIALDHGDAGPRAMILFKFKAKAGDTDFDGSNNNVNLISFQGFSGKNYTGASIGGLEYSDSSYLVAGNSVVQNDNWLDYYVKNIFVSVTSRDDFTSDGTEFKWITNYDPNGTVTASTPQLVKIDDDSFLLLWTTIESKIVTGLQYVYLDGKGNQTSEIFSVDGRLSDCQPTVSNDGSVVWYVTGNGSAATHPAFYSITDGKLDVNGTNHTWSKPTWIWSDDYSSAEATSTCADCGVTKTVVASVISEIVQPTCTDPEKINYTATADFGGTVYKDTVALETGSALGHLWGEAKWTWAENYSSASVSRTCQRSGCGTKETVQATVTSQVISEPTEEKEGEVLYTASATFSDGTKVSDSMSAVIPYTDKEALDEEIVKAEAEEKYKDDYTADSWADFEAALDAAKSVLNDLTATQENVNEALAKLEQAYENLVLAPIPEYLQGFHEMNGSWYYFVNGNIAYGMNDVLEGTVNGSNGWWYIVNGQVQLNYTGVCDYSNAFGWWYVKNGKVDFGKTGIESNKYGWWRVVGGKVDFSCNSVEQNDYGWWYVVGGKVDFSYTGVSNYSNAYGWWYISAGKVDFSKTSIEPNNYGWWRVVGGKVDFSCNSVEQNQYGWWYVVGGKVDFSYTGVSNYSNAYGWWYISGGKVDFGKTSVEPNNYGWWRVVNGKVDFSFTGWATNSYGRWYCVGGKVDFSKS